MPSRLLQLVLLTTALIGCAPTPTSPGQAQRDPCESINRLLESYKTQFDDIRGSKNSFDRITIWSTNYHIVGSGCEIWSWQGGKFNYVCNYVAPDESAARSIYQRAANTIDSCTNSDWSRANREIQQGSGAQTLWHRADSSATVDLKLVETRGVGKPRWAVYLLIGDFNSQI
jgi:hypothetical protein